MNSIQDTKGNLDKITIGFMCYALHTNKLKKQFEISIEKLPWSNVHGTYNFHHNRNIPHCEANSSTETPPYFTMHSYMIELSYL